MVSPIVGPQAPLLTEGRLRLVVRVAADLAMPRTPYWVRDGRDGPERAIYVQRDRTRKWLELRQVCAVGDPARPTVDPILEAVPRTDPAAAYVAFADALEARGFVIHQES